MTEDNPKAFKHQLGAQAVRELETRLLAAAPDFDVRQWRAALAPLESLELKQRVGLLADALFAGLARPFPDVARVVVQALPPPVDPDLPNQFAFWVWPLVHVVGRHGTEHPHAALDALEQLTQRFSAEFDIRPFLVRYPELTLARLRTWARHPDKNVRRLVSEGSRPRLPWGERLQAFVRDPSPTLALLELLRDDPSPNVRRSVANHLGDVAKDHPERVVALLAGWRAEAPNDAALEALARHAVRHLVKAAHPGALALLGHGAPTGLVATLQLQEARVTIGSTLTFHATLSNPGAEPARAVLDYAVRYANAQGEQSRRKVFKWSERALAPGESLTLTRRQPMRPVSIRPLYPGEHTLELQVSGQVLARATFQLV